MKYITITSKHHDGFAMFDSKVSDYDIVERTPYEQGRPEACSPTSATSRASSSSSTTRSSTGTIPTTSRAAAPGATAGPARVGRLEHATSTTWTPSSPSCCTGVRRDRRHLVRRLVGQARGRLAARPDATSCIHELQPAALVGTNHHRKPFPGEDFQMFEQDLPGAEHGRLQRGLRARHPAARDLRDDQRLLGLQQDGRPASRARSSCVQLPGAAGRPRRQLPAERRPEAGRHDPARVRRAAWPRWASGCRRTARRSTARAAGRSRRAPGA